MQTKYKSIKTIFNKHLGEIYSLLQSKSQYTDLHNLVIKLLKSDDLKGNPDVYKAIEIFNKDAGNYLKYNHYISTLDAYITGIAVGK